ncbi:MAG: histidine kinase [Bacteroidales bacterium]|nr:histidine kinase [Bacteroidales bacterium]
MPEQQNTVESKISFTSDQKQNVATLCITALIAFVLFGEIPVEVSDVGLPVIVKILLLTAMFVTVCFLNIYKLIPRLLLRGRYFRYVSSLAALIVFFILMNVLFEWVIYQLQPEIYRGFFSKGNDGVRFFLLLYDFFTCFIFIGATSLIVFLHYLQKSGDRIRELEETSFRAELEKARNKIDSVALIDTLDKASVTVVSSPQETSQMLMELSKSLRQQLYESEHKRVFVEQTKHVFGEQNRLLNFLIEKRYRLVRNLLFLLVLGAISVSHSLTVAGVFLTLVYVNIYVLLPRLFFKNKLIWYIVAGGVLSVLIFVLLMVSLSLSSRLSLFETIKGLWWLYMIINTVTSGFILAGSTAFVLFQRWARNERYIAQLETATIRAELEQLQNQINPHFLFNMLNNILVLIRENPEEAAIILRKMSDMMKYQFNNSAKKEVLLNDDIQFFADFLNLEKIRRDRFEFSISTNDNVENVFVPPLLFIPFVENAVKHGNDTAGLSHINLHFRIVGDRLHFTCCNSKPAKLYRKNVYGGLGLINICRRLDLLYNENYTLELQDDETSYSVQLFVKISPVKV